MHLSNRTQPSTPVENQKKTEPNVIQSSSIDRGHLAERAHKACISLRPSCGIHSCIRIRSGGFEYINHGDAASCDKCGLKISNWTLDMEPFTIHKQRSPSCPFVQKLLPEPIMSTHITNNLGSTATVSVELEQLLNRSKTNNPVTNILPQKLIEVDTIKQIRKRTFSHWPHRVSPFSSQIIDAGFFNCNVGDRVICIYCNLICQQWTPNSDDPCEVHKILSPKCVYVVAKLVPSETSSISIVNDASTTDDSFRSHEIVYTAACNTNYIEIWKRAASFATWSNENLPPVDDLVSAGFFFTGTEATVTCFYCNGSLEKLSANDNPMIEHARWFPHCAYAKNMCGAELHRDIQELNKVQQERPGASNLYDLFGTNIISSTHGLLQISDENTLSRCVAARLDLPISQSLLDRNYKLSIIKRCWEDQLRIKHEAFTSDSDVLMACIIRQKQIEHIDGKMENITIPSVAMRRVQNARPIEADAREQSASGSPTRSKQKPSDDASFANP